MNLDENELLDKIDALEPDDCWAEPSDPSVYAQAWDRMKEPLTAIAVVVSVFASAIAFIIGGMELGEYVAESVFDMGIGGALLFGMGFLFIEGLIIWYVLLVLDLKYKFM